MSIVHGIFFEEKFIFLLLLLLRCCDVVMYPVYKYHLDTRRCGPRQQSLDKTFIISFTKHRNMTQTSSKGDPASILCCCCRPFATNIWGTELTGLGPSFCFFNCVVLIFCWKMKIRFSNSTIFHEKLRIYFAGRVACDVTVQWLPGTNTKSPPAPPHPPPEIIHPDPISTNARPQHSWWWSSILR